MRFDKCKHSLLTRHDLRLLKSILCWLIALTRWLRYLCCLICYWNQTRPMLYTVAVSIRESYLDDLYFGLKWTVKNNSNKLPHCFNTTLTLWKLEWVILEVNPTRGPPCPQSSLLYLNVCVKGLVFYFTFSTKEIGFILFESNYF